MRDRDESGYLKRHDLTPTTDVVRAYRLGRIDGEAEAFRALEDADRVIQDLQNRLAEISRSAGVGARR